MKKIKVGGKCKFCKEIISKKDSLQHFLSCETRQFFFEQNRQTTINDWFYLRAEHDPYWIDLLIPDQWLLSDLDRTLRSTWLECCGHLSNFRIDNVLYERFQDPDWLIGDEKLSPSMEVPLRSVLSPQVIFTHRYDYGSTTELQLQIIDSIKIPVRKQVFLCARNNPPNWLCTRCNQSATHICSYCYDYACCNCIDMHNCVIREGDDNMMAELVNSPRTGVCGYDGTQPAIDN